MIQIPQKKDSNWAFRIWPFKLIFSKLVNDGYRLTRITSKEVIDILYILKVKGLGISYDLGGYFDSRHRISIYLFYFLIRIYLPVKSKHEGCDPGSYGINIDKYMTLRIYKGPKEKDNFSDGSKYWFYTLPWFEFCLNEHLALMEMGTEGKYGGTILDGTAIWKDISYSSYDQEGERKREEVEKERWRSEPLPYTYVYRDSYSGRVREIQEVTCTLTIEFRSFYRKGFKWLKPRARTNMYMNISLNDEIGNGRGSFKGGAVGWSEEIKYGENWFWKIREIERTKVFTK